MGGQRGEDGAACNLQSFYHSDAFPRQPLATAASRKSGSPRVAVTIITGMRPQTIGRVLGIGVRVAGRMAGQRLAGHAQATAARPMTIPAVPLRAGAQNAARVTSRTGGAVAKGIGGFLRPFARVGGIIWLEVAGVFFLLPVLVFAPKAWQYRVNWLHGPQQRTFWASVVVVVVFLYLGISSFWRAHRKSATK